jgi:hypothetical protein
MPRVRPISIRVTETAEGRVVVSRYASGEETRELLVAKKARRKPRKPIARTWKPK